MSTNRMIEMKAASLFVEETGSGDSVLLISGLGYAHWCWQDLAGRLDTRWRTLAFDNRGTGQSSKSSGPYHIGLLADNAAAVLKSDGPGPAHVVGHSMGGYIALMSGPVPGWTGREPALLAKHLAVRLKFPTPPEAWAAQFEACEKYIATGAS